MRILQRYNVNKANAIVDPNDNTILVEMHVGQNTMILQLTLEDADMLKKEIVNASIILRDRLGVQ